MSLLPNLFSKIIASLRRSIPFSPIAPSCKANCPHQGLQSTAFVLQSAASITDHHLRQTIARCALERPCFATRCPLLISNLSAKLDHSIASSEALLKSRVQNYAYWCTPTFLLFGERTLSPDQISQVLWNWLRNYFDHSCLVL